MPVSYDTLVGEGCPTPAIGKAPPFRKFFDVRLAGPCRFGPNETGTRRYFDTPLAQRTELSFDLRSRNLESDMTEPKEPKEPEGWVTHEEAVEGLMRLYNVTREEAEEMLEQFDRDNPGAAHGPQ